jgi:prepilin-type N-terminal cleavage/methylation domain-containing protein
MKTFREFRPVGAERGFTVIELLIVISILLVLGLVVLAGAGKLRNKADAAKSVANLKQLVSIHQSFTVDNRFIVNQNDTRLDGKKLHWSEWLAIQITESDEADVWNTTFSNGASVFADGAAFRAAKGQIKSDGTHNSWRTYCYNNTIGALDPEAASGGSNKGWTKGALIPTQVTSPEKLILFSLRKFAASEGRFLPYLNRTEKDENMDFSTHKGVVYASFYDGHVTSFARKNWPDSDGIRESTGKPYNQTELNQFWWGRDSAVER